MLAALPASASPTVVAQFGFFLVGFFFYDGARLGAGISSAHRAPPPVGLSIFPHRRPRPTCWGWRSAVAPTLPCRTTLNN